MTSSSPCRTSRVVLTTKSPPPPPRSHTHDHSHCTSVSLLSWFRRSTYGTIKRRVAPSVFFRVAARRGLDAERLASAPGSSPNASPRTCDASARPPRSPAAENRTVRAHRTPRRPRGGPRRPRATRSSSLRTRSSRKEGSARTETDARRRRSRARGAAPRRARRSTRAPGYGGWARPSFSAEPMGTRSTTSPASRSLDANRPRPRSPSPTIVALTSPPWSVTHAASDSTSAVTLAFVDETRVDAARRSRCAPRRATRAWEPRASRWRASSEWCPPVAFFAFSRRGDSTRARRRARVPTYTPWVYSTMAQLRERLE